MEFLNTVIRKRNGVKFFGMANNVSLVNPHFMFWQVRIKPGQRFNKSTDGMVVVEMFTDEGFIKEMEDTEFGKLIKNTEYGRYAIHNECLVDKSTFICDRPNEVGEFYCSFIIEGKEIGIWKYEDKFFIDTKVDTTSKKRYTITSEDHTPNYQQVLTINRRPIILMLKEAYSKNLIYYSNNNIQTLFTLSLQYL